MTADQRNLLLLLGKMIFPNVTENNLRAVIFRIESAESKSRDQFVDKIMKGSE